MYKDLFRKQRIDGGILRELTNEELIDMGVKSFHVRKLRRCVQKVEYASQLAREGIDDYETAGVAV